MLDIHTLPQHVAQGIIDAVGEVGQPPHLGAEYLQIGLSPVLDLLDQEYFLRFSRTGRGSTFKLAQAYFGGGKSLLIRCLVQRAWNRGMCTAVVDLSPTECPFDDTLALYTGVAMALSWRPQQEFDEPDRGIDATLVAALTELQGDLGNEGLRQWLDSTLRRAPIDSRVYRAAILAFAHAWLDGDFETEELVAAWLRGDEVLISEVRHLNIRGSITKKTGMRMMRSLVQILRLLGGKGLMLAFDELDRNMALSPKRRNAVADNVRELIDYCAGGTLPGLFVVYGAPPLFMRDTVSEYVALQQRLEPPRALSVSSPQSALIDLEDLGIPARELLTTIGMRLLDIFEVARSASLDAEIQRQNMEKLAKKVSEATFSVGHRRAFVKAAVDLLYGQAVNEHALADDEIRTLAGDSAELVVLDGRTAMVDW